MFYDTSKVNGIDICEDEINDMSYSERCKFLNGSHVIVARYFQYRVELFFKITALNDPLGKRNYYTRRVDFQVSSSPHNHFFICTLNASYLCSDKNRLYTE